MRSLTYESHQQQTAELPFIFHPEFSVVRHHCSPNWHENIELLYCLSGEGTIRCGTEIQPFLPGDLYVVNHDLTHCVYSDTAVLYRCLIIDNTFLRSNGIPTPIYFQPLIRDDRFGELLAHLAKSYTCHGAGKPYAVPDIRHTVLSILLLLCREFALDAFPDATPAADEYVKNAIVYIRKNLASPITLDSVAEAVGVSKYHLSRSFKAVTGKTIIEMTNIIRCTEAKRLLENGASVSTAATTCGYENLSYFSRTFRRIFNRLPSEFHLKKH